MLGGDVAATDGPGKRLPGHVVARARGDRGGVAVGRAAPRRRARWSGGWAGSGLRRPSATSRARWRKRRSSWRRPSPQGPYGELCRSPTTHREWTHRTRGSGNCPDRPCPSGASPARGVRLTGRREPRPGSSCMNAPPGANRVSRPPAGDHGRAPRGTSGRARAAAPGGGVGLSPPRGGRGGDAPLAVPDLRGTALSTTCRSGGGTPAGRSTWNAHPEAGNVPQVARDRPLRRGPPHSRSALTLLGGRVPRGTADRLQTRRVRRLR